MAAANSETESSASRFRLTIKSLKLAKEGLEKELSESQRVLSCAAQLDEENRTKLEELRKSTALKQENYSMTEQKLQEEASKVDSLEQELKDAASKLRATEQALETAEAKVEELSNGKSLSEGMLTAVHVRLQSCEKATVEKDAAIIELEKTLSRRDEELQELSGENDTRQSQLTETENSLRSAQEARIHAEKKAGEERAWITQDFSRREQEMRDSLEDEKQKSSSLEEEIGRLKDEVRELTAQKVSAIDQEKEMVIQLKAKPQDAEHQANCSVKRVEELLQEKRGQYDAMQLAEREFKIARAGKLSTPYDPRPGTGRHCATSRRIDSNTECIYVQHAALRVSRRSPSGREGTRRSGDDPQEEDGSEMVADPPPPFPGQTLTGRLPPAVHTETRRSTRQRRFEREMVPWYGNPAHRIAWLCLML